MGVVVIFRGQRFDQPKVVFAVDLLLQFIAIDGVEFGFHKGLSSSGLQIASIITIMHEQIMMKGMQRFLVRLLLGVAAGKRFILPAIVTTTAADSCPCKLRR